MSNAMILNLWLGLIFVTVGIFFFAMATREIKPKQELVIPESYIEDGWHGRLVLVRKVNDGYVKEYYKIGNYEFLSKEYISAGGR